MTNKTPRKKRDALILGLFLCVAVLVLSNGFTARLLAQEKTVDVYREVEPIGIVLDRILREYVRDVDIQKVVEGALSGMLSSLDRNSSFINAKELQEMQEDTKGEFEGIGVSIRPDENGNIIVFYPIPGSPAAAAGIKAFDRIVAIDGKPTAGMNTQQASELIRGPRGSKVRLTILRKDRSKPDDPGQQLDIEVQRDKVPLESIKEHQILKDKVGYVRISDFKDNTGADLAKHLNAMLQEGIVGLVLDLRWNPGGLLTASRDTCELFLPKGSLVTYTRGRKDEQGRPNREDLKLVTSRNPIVPEGLPIIVLVNRHTASSAEIVTGALQYHQRAIILGEKTFGKGSVQTIIPLERPANTAMRLTTALYYTPANVTIDEQGILPDIELSMTPEQEEALAKQMFASFENEPENQYRQNHGRMTDYPVTDQTVDDTQLLKAWEILREVPVWADLLKQYHRDVRETQMSAEEAARRNGKPAEGEAAPQQAPSPENTPAEAPGNAPEPEPAPVEMP